LDMGKITMDREFNVILPLSDECQSWCEERNLDVGPLLPMESIDAREIQKKFAQAGFIEGKDYAVY